MKHRIRKRKCPTGISKIITTEDGGVILGRTGSYHARRRGRLTEIEREIQLRRKLQVT